MENIYEKDLRNKIDETVNFVKENRNITKMEKEYKAIIEDDIYELMEIMLEKIGYNCKRTDKLKKNRNFKEDEMNLLVLNFFDKKTNMESKYQELHKDRGIYKLDINLNNILEATKKLGKKTRINAINKLIENCFYAVNSLKQDLIMDTDISNKYILKIAREKALIENLDNDFYWNNYSELLSTIDSQKVSNKLSKEYNSEYNGNKYSEEKLKRLEILGGYKLNNNSYDGRYKYESNAIEDRDEVSISVLDHIICERKPKDILKKHPYLLKEYNANYTKKTAKELIENMKKENVNILKNNRISSEQKEEIINDCEYMYYELIYNQLGLLTKNDIKDISKSVDIKKLLINIKEYFENKKNMKYSAENKIYYEDYREDFGHNNLKKSKIYDNNIKYINNYIIEVNRVLNREKNNNETVLEKNNNETVLEKNNNDTIEIIDMEK